MSSNKITTSGFRPSSKISSTGKETKNVSYTFHGWHDYLDDNDIPVLCDTKTEKAGDRDRAFAKSVNGQFFVKCNTSGQMYNPLDQMHGGSYAKENARMGKMWEFRSVPKISFDRYLQFLRTKNVSYLLNAEREMI